MFYTYIAVLQPVDTTVCQYDNATFTCVIFLSSGIPTTPGWLRNGVLVDMMHHPVTSNLTGGATLPVYVSGTITISNVTVFDDGALYQCGIGSTTSDSATLNVVGKCKCHDLMLPLIMTVFLA